MYDLIPLSMKAQFNSINLSNQSIKLNVSLDEKKSNKKDLSNYTYNKVIIFNYSINLQNSQINLNIYNKTSNKSYFYKIVLGSFVYQTAVKFSSSIIIVNSKNKSDLDSLVFGFLQKDYIYSLYKHKSKKSLYKTNYKLPNNFFSLLNSINFLKELVSEPSNIIYPTSFVKRTMSQIKKSNINIKTLNKAKIQKIGLNCLLAVSQGSKREPAVMKI